MSYSELIESIEDHYHAEDWVKEYVEDVDDDRFSYFQEAAFEIAKIAFDAGMKVGYQDAVIDIQNEVTGWIYDLANPLKVM